MKIGRFIAITAAALLASALALAQGIPTASLTGKVTSVRTRQGLAPRSIAASSSATSIDASRDCTTIVT